MWRKDQHNVILCEVDPRFREKDENRNGPTPSIPLSHLSDLLPWVVDNHSYSSHLKFFFVGRKEFSSEEA